MDRYWTGFMTTTIEHPRLSALELSKDKWQNHKVVQYGSYDAIIRFSANTERELWDEIEQRQLQGWILESVGGLYATMRRPT